MMKKYLYQTLCLAAALAMTACTQDELTDDTLPEGMYPLEIGSVTLSAEVSEQPWGAKSPQTRVTESADGNSSVWENLDEFYAKTAGANEYGMYRITNAATGTVTATRTTYWTKTTEDVTAWYPQSGMVSLANQSNALAYVLQATTLNASCNGPVTLNFKHQLAKVRVKANDVLSSKPVEISSVEICSSTKCTHTRGGNLIGSDEDWITMKLVTYDGETCWEANVVPGKTITRFRINGSTESTLQNNGITPVAGAVNTITITVESNTTKKL